MNAEAGLALVLAAGGSPVFGVPPRRALGASIKIINMHDSCLRYVYRQHRLGWEKAKRDVWEGLASRGFSSMWVGTTYLYMARSQSGAS